MQSFKSKNCLHRLSNNPSETEMVSVYLTVILRNGTQRPLLEGKYSYIRKLQLSGIITTNKPDKMY